MNARFSTLVLLLLGSTSLVSCEKLIGGKSDTCEKIRSAKIQVSKTNFYAGEEIRLSTVEGTNIFYGWNHSNINGNLGSSSSYIIPTCTKSDEGWFYVSVSNPDCTTKYDSVYISVTNQPVAAPCTPINNKVDFSSIPDITFGSASWSYDASYNARNLRGYQALGYPDINVFFHSYWNNKEPEDGAYALGYPDINVFFHSYWNNKEPEDGAYALHNTFSFIGVNTYSVYVTTHYGINLYVANNTGKVYVSHVNGKIQVTFCNLPFSGNGSTFTASGKLTAP
jgi:hypothetical protein